MKRFTFMRTVVCAAVFLLVLPVYAAKAANRTSIPGLFRYKLENGLELFVMENDAAPLAYIEIAVRAGGVTQVPETTGLFHLYEHMMFKGNAKYANQAAVQDAINELGISDWNGTTSVDRVNYYFTVPASLVRDGLEFWSYAIRTPLLDEKELENEKGVVLSEIGAHYSDPSYIFLATLNSTLFPDEPWKLDTAGMPDTVQNATVEQLKAMQAQYYVPNNAAVFVGGDVHHETIYKYVKEIYGDWKRGNDVPSVTPPTKTPFTRTDATNGQKTAPARNKFVYPDSRASDAYVQASMYFRGPDGETDKNATYSADVLLNILNNPVGSFKTALLADDLLAIPDADYIDSFYVTRRASGFAGTEIAMMNLDRPVEQAEHFFTSMSQIHIPSLAGQDTLNKTSLETAKQQMENNRIYALETAQNVLSALSALWASCGSEYFFSYDSKIAAVTESDIQRLLQDYARTENAMQVVFVSPDVYEAHKAAFEKAGYQEITAEKAFWWQKK